MTSDDVLPTQEVQPHVCVIGAGVCGLVSVKICLETGLRVSCYERSNKYGGLWNYRPDEKDPKAPFEPSVMWTTVLNTSKELSAFSDFPPPPTSANFMRHTYYMDYIRSYVDHFNLLPHISLGHEILSCEPELVGVDEQGEVEAKWTVRIKNLQTQEVRTEKFDRLMVAVGHHNIPFLPSYPGQERFRGQIIHSARLKNILADERFVDKKVVVVGLGNSACDAANDLSMVADKCYVSCHRGQWFTSRFLPEGPYDFQIKSRIYNYATKILPASVIDSKIIERCERRTNHKMLGLKPKHKPSEGVPAINDLFPYRIYTGGIVLKTAIKTFTETGIVFEGEEDREYPIDVVVFATGYEGKIPFLEEQQLGLRAAEHNNEYELFLNIFAPKLRLPSLITSPNKNSPLIPNSVEDTNRAHNLPTPWSAIKSLAFIGLVQPNGSMTVISELQARYAALVFKGERKLPKMKEMIKHMEGARRMRSKALRSHSRDQLIGSYVGYMETLAQLIGVRPNLSKLFFTDHKLWKQLIFGPCVPYQWRLTGFGHRPEAREIVLSSRDRVYCGINEGKNHILYKTQRKYLHDKKT